MKNAYRFKPINDHIIITRIVILSHDDKEDPARCYEKGWLTKIPRSEIRESVEIDDTNPMAQVPEVRPLEALSPRAKALLAKIHQKAFEKPYSDMPPGCANPFGMWVEVEDADSETTQELELVRFIETKREDRLLCRLVSAREIGQEPFHPAQEQLQHLQKDDGLDPISRASQQS